MYCWLELAEVLPLLTSVHCLDCDWLCLSWECRALDRVQKLLLAHIIKTKFSQFPQCPHLGEAQGRKGWLSWDTQPCKCPARCLKELKREFPLACCAGIPLNMPELKRPGMWETSTLLTRLASSHPASKHPHASRTLCFTSHHHHSLWRICSSAGEHLSDPCTD